MVATKSNFQGRIKGGKDRRDLKNTKEGFERDRDGEKKEKNSREENNR